MAGGNCIKDIILWKKIKDLFVAKTDSLEANAIIMNDAKIVTADDAQTDVEESGPNLSGLIRQHLAPVLRADGFTGSGRSFRKNHTDWLFVLTLETSRAGNAFALHVGIQPKFAPDTLGKPVDPKKLKVQLCEFRRRISSTAKDQWWDFEATEESMITALQAAASVYVEHMRPLVHAICAEPSIFAEISVEKFNVQAMGFEGFASDEGRLALATARYLVLKKQHEKARTFAEHGLRHVGISVGLQRDFEELLNCLEQAKLDDINDAS